MVNAATLPYPHSKAYSSRSPAMRESGLSRLLNRYWSPPAFTFNFVNEHVVSFFGTWCLANSPYLPAHHPPPQQ